MNCLSPSRWNILHKTQVNAPIDEVWDPLIDIDNWEWNKWTKLKADEASTGTSGTLLASYEGNGIYEEFDFTFGEVNAETYSMNWFGDLGPSGIIFHGDHTIKLEEGPDPDTTNIIHTEQFTGLGPILGIGLPYETLDRNYLLMNEALRDYVENNNTIS